jgi:hypothetical protein
MSVRLFQGDAGVIGDGAVGHVDDLGQPVRAGRGWAALEVGDEVVRNSRRMLAMTVWSWTGR